MGAVEKKIKTAFVCTKCGAIHPRWQGQCKECGDWNCLSEERLVSSKKPKAKKTVSSSIPLPDISLDKFEGIRSGNEEFDRVLGGSLLPGSSILLAGEPGIGKSTLVLQVAEDYSARNVKVLYVTGEESAVQLKKRSQRLNVNGENIIVASTIELEEITALIEANRFDVVIVDSIQTVSCSYFNSPPGTIGQIREAASRLIEICKKKDTALIMIGHVTKEGMVAGPKVLEHMVDCVLQFEGDNRKLFRLLRSSKNRFGATFELGVFEMTRNGLLPVENPSSLFLSEDHGLSRTGAVVAASCEGNRPILVEIQALVSPASYGTPQRVAGGIDNKRLALLLAILEKRAGIPMGGNDVFVSVAGGMRLTEPATDLAVMTAIVSSLRDLPIDSKTVIIGEVGLSGEVRGIGLADRRVAEAAKLGFSKSIIPESNCKGIEITDIANQGVKTLEEALELLF